METLAKTISTVTLLMVVLLVMVTFWCALQYAPYAFDAIQEQLVYMQARSVDMAGGV